MEDISTISKLFSTQIVNVEPIDKTSRQYFDNLRSEITSGDSGSRIVQAVDLMISNNVDSGLMCWDFVFLCYYIAQCKIIHDEYNVSSKTIDTKARSKTLKKDSEDFGNTAGEDILKKIKVGTWLYINNHNSSDVNGNHSVVALSDYSGGIIKVASQWNSHQVGKYHQIDPHIDGQRVVYVGTPGVVGIDDSFFNLRGNYVKSWNV